jgi:hypothetical protein
MGFVDKDSVMVRASNIAVLNPSKVRVDVDDAFVEASRFNRIARTVGNRGQRGASVRDSKVRDTVRTCPAIAPGGIAYEKHLSNSSDLVH